MTVNETFTGNVYIRNFYSQSHCDHKYCTFFELFIYLHKEISSFIRFSSIIIVDRYNIFHKFLLMEIKRKVEHKFTIIVYERMKLNC